MLDINPDLALKNANIVSHALPDKSVAQLVTKKMQTWQVAHLADLSHNCLSDEPGPANPAGETKSERGPMMLPMGTGKPIINCKDTIRLWG